MMVLNDLHACLPPCVCVCVCVDAPNAATIRYRLYTMSTRVTATDRLVSPRPLGDFQVRVRWRTGGRREGSGWTEPTRITVESSRRATVPFRRTALHQSG